MQPDDNMRFRHLSKVAQTVMVIPNSNAECERVFSCVKKIHTSFRSEMNNETLCCLLVLKINNEKCCYESLPSAETLKLAKSATKAYCDAHK